MTIPAFPDITNILDEVREKIQRPVTINIHVQGTACPTCSLDPVTGTSTDSFCATCSGMYWLSTTSGYDTYGHVRWLSADRPLYTEGGTIDMGDCVVTLKYNTQTLSYVQNSESFIIDGRDLYLKEYVLRGVQSLNRIRVILKEDSN